MPDFDAVRSELMQSRNAWQEARAAAALANERLKTITAAQTKLARRTGPDDRAGTAERARLEELAQRAAADLAAARDTVQRAGDAAGSALGRFAEFTDPRRNVGRLSDAAPFALFPVRLETRFMTAGSGDNATPQLWVRIYPDDCSIDTFEATLSAAELQNAQRYWQGIWRAGGIEAGERAAWADLVAAHGSGRAGYIVDTYQPVNVADKPVKAHAADEILVIATQTALNATEAAAVSAYWQAIWLAGDDAVKQQAARATLDAAVGGARAGQLIAAYRPYNLADRPAAPFARETVALTTAYLLFPPDPPTRNASWSGAPHVAQFPERFVVLGFNDGVKTLEAIGNVITLPLYVGPDPSADPAADPSSSIHPDGGDLFIPDPMRWMVDFDRAVAAGMGIAIDLTPAQARSGFDRLLVLGLQLSADADDGRTGLETLLHHHAAGRSSLALVPQGTPTHNSSGVGSGHSRSDDPDLSFDDRRNSPLFTPTADAADKRDGQWLAELLGIESALLQTVHGAGGRDQLQARAMQRALWPATLGYWMDKLMTPVFNDDAIANTRWFVTEYVSGRGAAPAIRIGGQPYGVLPTTAFSRIRWLDPQPGRIGRLSDPRRIYLHALYTVLRAADADWTAMAAASAHLGGAGDAHRQLLDVVGLHPASVEFHSRYAESLSELFNTINLWGLGPDFVQAVIALGLHTASAGVLAKLGYHGTTQPDIFSHYFLRDAGQITQVIDDRPLSESDPIRSYTDDHRNYLQWLIDAANTSLDALRLEAGFSNNATPQALLYLYARHALMLGYYDTSYELHKAAGVLSDAQLAAMKPEPAFVHVDDAAVASESRFGALYKTQAAITGNASQMLTDYITRNYRFLTAANGLRDQLDALARLVDASTAQLERAFVEHIDLCSYRFDAWLLGIVNYQLQRMRETDGQRRQGVYLGAYGWLEDLRPSTVRLTAAQLPEGVAENFPGAKPILHDPSNGGFIHAPSLTHARTAAILRSGYLANATPSNPGTMAVNLSSTRVRTALALLEGIRNGQSLGALLGYQFERGLHDAHGLAEVDKFIYPLRKAFPLVADTLASTKTAPDVPIEAIEARNVFDGRKMIAQIDSSGIRTYPFGLTTLLPTADDLEQAALDAQTEALLDAYDAIADLALAEGVHQAAQGNFDRIAATLDAYTVGNFPPEPQVVHTPLDGIGLTHRVALQLQAGIKPVAGATPRAQVQPALEAWLAGVLPPFDRIGCVVSWTDSSGNPQHLNVLCSDLAVGALDLVGLLHADASQAMTELDDRVMRFVITTAGPRPDATLNIAYMTAPPDAFSMFEAGALLRSLGTLLRSARPLKASDAALAGAAAPDTDSDVSIDRERIALPKAALDALDNDITADLGALAPLVADPVANRTALINGIDGFIDDAVALLERASRFGLPLCGWGFAYAWRHDAVRDLLAQVAALLDRWQMRLTEFDGKLAAYDALPAATGDDDRLAALRAAELLISTQPAPPTTPVLLRNLLDGRRAAFDARRGQFAAVLASSGTQFIGFFNAVNALLPVSEYDAVLFDITAFGNRAVRFAQELSTNLAGHQADLDACAHSVQVQLDAHDAAATATLRVTALDAAAKALFGDDFHIVPEFGLNIAHSDEWANALAASSGGVLFSYLKTTAGIDFPVEEWLCGAARVRPALRAWESVAAFSSALGRPEPRLTAVQFPYEADAPWLAMQFPSTYRLDGDRLLYTAHYAAAFDKNARQCGLLLDEWSEVIPSTTHTTGLTFNFNRPDNEAPQVVLLVTPATAGGTWEWDDLVGALNETLDLAKKRAVEPAQLDGTPYAPLVPATVMAATLYGVSIATSLSVANGVMHAREIADHG